MQHIIAQVNVAAVGHGTNQVVALVHPPPEAIEEGLRLRLERTGERKALHRRRRTDPRETEQGGREIDEADQAVGFHPGGVLLRREMTPLGGKIDDHRHAQTRVRRPTLAARQAGAVIGIVKYDRVVGEPGFRQLLQLLAGDAIHGADDIIILRPVVPDLRGVGMVGRNPHYCRIRDERMRPLDDLALVAESRIKDGEERLAGGAVAPVGLDRGFVPDLPRLGEVIVLLVVVRAVVAGVPEILRVHLDAGRKGHLAPHVFGAEGRGQHARDDRGAGGGADRGVRPDVAEEHAPRRQCIHVGRTRQRVAVAAHLLAVVLTGDPEDVGVIGGTGAGEEPAETKADRGEEA